MNRYLGKNAQTLTLERVNDLKDELNDLGNSNPAGLSNSRKYSDYLECYESISNLFTDIMAGKFNSPEIQLDITSFDKYTQYVHKIF